MNPLMKPLQILCPAKINLGLGVTGRRADGYHLLRMVMQSIDLADTLTLTPTPRKGILITCDTPGVPLDGRNIVHRAAAAFFAAYERASGRAAPFGLAVHIEKRIPSQAGLGGGSADGAGVLLGLNRLLGEPFSMEELCTLGSGVGADIPFCLVGGTALVEGIGEVLTPLTPMPHCHILLAKPKVGVSTPACFAAYDRLEPPPPWEDAPLLAALEAGSLPALGRSLFNVLEGPAGVRSVAAIRELLLQSGAEGALMSGSGSAVFGLFHTKEGAAAAAQRLEALGYWHALAQPTRQGPIILQKEIAPINR